jgi:hypothetical protein
MKTFRNLLASGEQDRIRLSTKDGKSGYKIKKFEAIGTDPGATSQEAQFKIFSVEQDTPYTDSTVDLSSPLILAALFYETSSSTGNNVPTTVIVDDKVINQDIFVVLSGGGVACNYYLELEEIKLSEHEAAVATLKDMRGRE